MEPAVCCDIHKPTAFSQYDSNIPKPARSAQRSRLPKYTKGKHDYDLQDALHDWREEKTADMYGWACLNDHGPSLVILNSILDRIIDCAHHGKIHTSQDLQKETGWTDSEKDGSEILSLLTAHAPPRQSLLVATPLRHNTTNNPMLLHVPTASGMQRERVELPVSAVASKHWNKCSACGQEGHNARNRICPNHPSRTNAQPQEKENGTLLQ
ncbi:hypothetical protein PAXINDRAFT_17430 [Paxillus involutus ATCC 200175]|uniref:Unplaced genomic scaffold PAXINscaffold_136, whole genome shotgun sequence n=1 Tax=Paxillus involutus ATCC 200175 TaxID=664439 RepID=A0A0C9SQ93_PAXIN|nr:hypothetical protein PAXINDRAFT_17430 [Paxillus involutus ATCC 200175]